MGCIIEANRRLLLVLWSIGGGVPLDRSFGWDVLSRQTVAFCWFCGRLVVGYLSIGALDGMYYRGKPSPFVGFVVDWWWGTSRSVLWMGCIIEANRCDFGLLVPMAVLDGERRYSSNIWLHVSSSRVIPVNIWPRTYLSNIWLCVSSSRVIPVNIWRSTVSLQYLGSCQFQSSDTSEYLAEHRISPIFGFVSVPVE